ncbi:MAG TPA: decaprenyl-phosphate phosphoribosyltransferase [Acidobacteriota bacterium]|nr:decaprenyl-phosphate phosphoribosyltransferase [Acidobacteriota bacterium]
MKETVATAEPVVEFTLSGTLKEFILSLRPYQWTKNLVIFAALVFAKELLNVQHLLIATAAFLDFCFLSGAVYVLNDVVDYKHDRFHPIKRQRPIASGRLSRSFAASAGIFLFISSLVTAYLIDRQFFIIALLYTLVTFGYTYYFKNIAILDVMAISLGFVLRAIAGGAVIHVEASFWLLLCTFLLALFLALSKRRHELVFLSEDAVKHRTNLAEYSPYLLDQMIGVVTASCVIAYTLYTVSAETIAKFQTDKLSLTIPFVIFGIFRYLYLIHQRKEGGTPSLHLISDKPLLISIVLWVIACVTIVYSTRLPWLSLLAPE